jgi:hypothetical protein
MPSTVPRTVPRTAPILAIVLAGVLAACADTGTRASDPTAYSGERSNVMDCNALTPAQRQFINLQRYGCTDIPTPADSGGR